jgi:hypothetical protein
MVGVNASTDATIDQTRLVSAEIQRAHAQARQAKLLFDAAVLMRIGDAHWSMAPTPTKSPGRLVNQPPKPHWQHLNPATCPCCSPKSSCGQRWLCHVLLGNPPWEKVKVEVSRWWALRFPGSVHRLRASKIASLQSDRIQRPDLAHEYDDDVQKTALLRHVIISGPVSRYRLPVIQIYIKRSHGAIGS